MEPCVERHGAHLIEIGVRGDRGRPVVEVFIDNELGVTSGLCADVSRSLIEAIDASGTLHESYRLDVSSPGIDRPLQHAWQFKKHLGRKVKVAVRDGTTSTARSGILLSCDDNGIVLEEKRGEPGVRFSHDRVLEITVMSPW